MADNTRMGLGTEDGDWLRNIDRSGIKTPISLLDVGGAASEALLGDSGVQLPTKLVDPTATTGSISAADSASSTGSANSLSQIAITGTPTTNSAVQCVTNGQQSILIQLSGTFNGTVYFERSLDGGVTWFAHNIEVLDNLAVNNVAISDNKQYILRAFSCGSYFRVRCTARSSGTLSVVLQPTFGLGQVTVKQGLPTTVGSAWPVFAVGEVAHDAADANNPVKLGAYATTGLTAGTNVGNADRTNLKAGVDGALIVRPNTNLEDIVSGNANNTDGSSTQCIAAQGSGIKTYLTTIILTNTSASNIYVEIKDGSTVKLTIPLPANGGAIVTLPVPLGGTANTAWNFDPSAATTTVYCSMVGFTSKI